MGILLAPDQPGGFEHLDVLGDGGKAHVMGLGELAHARLALRQPRENGAAGRIGKRVKEQREIGIMLSHIANYSEISW